MDVENENQLKKREFDLNDDNQEKESFYDVESKQEKRLILSEVDFQEQRIPLLNENLVCRYDMPMFSYKVNHPSGIKETVENNNKN